MKTPIELAKEYERHFESKVAEAKRNYDLYVAQLDAVRQLREDIELAEDKAKKADSAATR